MSQTSLVLPGYFDVTNTLRSAISNTKLSGKLPGTSFSWLTEILTEDVTAFVLYYQVMTMLHYRNEIMGYPKYPKTDNIFLKALFKKDIPAGIEVQTARSL